MTQASSPDTISNANLPERAQPPVQTRYISISNQKGGVGKTTTSVNLAASLAATKRRVLLIDCDPQGNATMGCGVDKRTVQRSTTDVLLGECDVASALMSLEYSDFKLLPGNQDLVAAEVELMGKPGCESRLRDALRPVLDQFDVVLIDCLTLWVTNLMLEERDMAAEFAALAAYLPEAQARLVFVSNEVGLGIVPENRMAREFLDHAGRLHQIIAEKSAEVYFVAAGLPLKMKG